MALFIVPDIRASRVNLMMNDYAAGLPSPLSFLGLGDLMTRELGLAPWSARVLAVLHQVTPSEGRTKPEMQPDGGVFSPIETMEDMTGTVDLSLLLDLPGCDSESQLREALIGRRIAGGLIQNDVLSPRAVTPDGSAFRGLRRGFAMLAPADPERRITSHGSPESLRALAAELFPAERVPGSGWLVPVAVGYRLLEDPETAPQRLRTRSKAIPHVFAEPLVGIAELVSVRNPRLTGLSAEALSEALWGWSTTPEFALGHSAYLPA